ncbi:hypothetical protein PCG10_009904 [Penicillium crustosum]|uniref:MYND-type domain-containing protein n=1 Tax=Penicillium crustosum TaxID=36656 RepID=A0A9P5KWC2_PENCR|nr:hypothetical protein PCG10_009904 [Penicillium crustosum]
MSGFDKFLNPAFCANNINSPCPNKTSKANNACSRCYLVVYCSRECQKEHWPVHKEDCNNILAKDTWKPDWHTEDRDPTFFQTDPSEPNSNANKMSWWGNMPALDLLKLDGNEGQDASSKMRILLTSSHDIRNILETVARLPDTYSGECDIAMNGVSFGVFAQNIVLVLTAFHFPPEEATPIMIHLWYSALIPTSVLTALQTKLLPLIEKVCTEAALKRPKRLFKWVWKKNKSSLQLELLRDEWERLRYTLRFPGRFPASEATRNRQEVVLADKRVDSLHRTLHAQPRYWRLSTMKFRRDGILLPFGCSRKEFDTPNPILFSASRSWPMPDSADPRSSWDIREVCTGAYTANYPAKNDLYGMLFIHLRETFLRFCRQLRKRNITIRLISIDTLSLPGYFKKLEHPGFDRIETYINAEKDVLGIEITLALNIPLLKPKIENPKAMILVLFVCDIEEMFSFDTMDQDVARVAKYLPEPETTDYNDADQMRRRRSSSFVCNVSKLFDLYKKAHGFDKIPEKYGLKMRGNNTIVAHWLMRPGKNAPQEVFDILEGSGATGFERYVEWEWA